MSMRAPNLALDRETVVFAVCALLAVTLLALPRDARVLVADRLAAVLTGPYWSVRNFGEDVGRVHERNAWLQERVVQLELQAAAGERMQRDALRLAGPALDPGYEGELVPCRVVMRERGRFATMIKIESLVPVAWEPWLPVISQAGYLGRLRSVINDREAWVELLTAPDFALGVEFERTGLLGILRPRADAFVVEMVGRDEDVLAGDLVITSGIAEVTRRGDDPAAAAVTPRGFPVGTVSRVDTPTDQIFKGIELEPAADFDYNETVFVVVPLGGGRGRR
ncbi:MAG: rod shape-determining protein MreC [Krumholzibacteria bacterium]|nr:rod shape-determining protein MreC [Candidatus Krumholzibacteria bacterium]